jgi:hypothetical protein
MNLHLLADIVPPRWRDQPGHRAAGLSMSWIDVGGHGVGPVLESVEGRPSSLEPLPARLVLEGDWRLPSEPAVVAARRALQASGQPVEGADVPHVGQFMNRLPLQFRRISPTGPFEVHNAHEGSSHRRHPRPPLRSPDGHPSQLSPKPSGPSHQRRKLFCGFV